MNSRSDSRIRLAIVADLINETYGPYALHPNADPLGELIATILSQNTSDVNMERSYRSLRETFATWDEIVSADTAAVIAAIRIGGLANSKAPRIQSVLRDIRERVGGDDLASLATMSLDAAKAWLTSLPGVGPKTAACVLLFSLGMPAMPVDTHVHRLSRRIGFVGPKVSAEETEDVLETLLGDNPDRIYSLHRGLLAHGRTICRARTPNCADCILKEHCDFFRDLQH
ncbi:MAG TPA: endonuclease III [Thermomicrobiales bacterium]|nr:endonuclease III [Thermomicrobiales bacterium]